MLYERVHYQVGNRGTSPSSSEAETSLLSAHGAISHTREILQSTNRATRVALSHLSDSAWWRHTLGNLRPAQHAAVELDDRNVDLLQLGCHPFYESLHTDCYVNKVITSVCMLYNADTFLGNWRRWYTTPSVLLHRFLHIWHPAWGRGTSFPPFSPLVHSLSHPLLFFYFSIFSVALTIFFFVRPFPFYQNSPTPFPGQRS